MGARPLAASDTRPVPPKNDSASFRQELIDHKDEYAHPMFAWGETLTKPHPGFGHGHFGYAQAAGSVLVDPAQYSMRSLELGVNRHIFDINLHTDVEHSPNVDQYYRLCKDLVGLHVTTSCFTAWRKSKRTNGYAKVIPAVPVSDNEAVRVFFFDDNLELGGKEDSVGICNLRHAHTGAFVDFAEGRNGFVCESAARHTVIHASTMFRTVLVKANILDAMEDPEYFSNIIERYALPHEQLVIFMDVNSTIVCNDTVQGKDFAQTLLSAMFEFVHFRARKAFDLCFDDLPCRRIDTKTRSLKGIVKEITGDDRDAYSMFWTEETCWRFFTDLATRGEVVWSGEETPFTLQACQDLFQEYKVSLSKVITKDGIAGSWFRVFDALQAEGRHSLILNSFGVDTRKVILATLPDERRVIQVTVNYDLWDDRDMQKFQQQFKS